MSGYQINRRKFLKLMGWSAAGTALAGCDLPSTVTLEEGEEFALAYTSPQEYNIPGIGVWYASTCVQCPANCGLHGRVREGHPLKLEGNPESPVNLGKTCQMGQAGIQGHYNPDRITRPMLRRNGNLVEIGWDEAMGLLEQQAGPDSNLKGDRFAWFTGAVSGHQAVLLASHLEAIGSKNHYSHEVIAPGVLRAVQRDMLGEAMPRYKLDEAKLILSFGADFMGGWGVSPVHFSTQYAKFRAHPRGILVQVEPKMTLTGANADLWLAVRPGTEGILALGVANLLLEGNKYAVTLPEAVRATISDYTPTKVAEITGIPDKRIEQLVDLLKQHAPSLVLAGPPVEGHAHGYQATAAVMLLNALLGNIGKTVVSSGTFPFPQLIAKPGSGRGLLDFAEAAKNKQLDVVFFHGANPVYAAPRYLKLEEQLQNIPFKVAFSQFPDETALMADLVLPTASYLEEWGTHVPEYQPAPGVISLQQPLMEKLYANTLGFGDMLLTQLKGRDPERYGRWDDYYTYLKDAFVALPGSYKEDSADDEAFWNQTLQTGLLKVEAPAQALQSKPVEINLPEYETNDAYPYHLVPAVQLGLWDGRHANLPWLQEAPDQITKVVWDSWAEMHPDTAQKLGIREGDMLEVASEQGAIQVAVILYKGIHPDAIAVPMGQGHEEYGRYAKGRGVNPLKILSPVFDQKTGELALYGTRVKVTNTGVKGFLVVEGRGNSSQVGRKLAGTIPADQFRRTEGA